MVARVRAGWRVFAVLTGTIVVACGSSSGGGGTAGSAGTSASGGSSGSGAQGGGGSAGAAGSALGGSGGSAGSVGGSAGSTAGTGGTGAVTSNADCVGLCTKTSAANCPDDPAPADCPGECQKELDAYAAECEAKSVALVECAKTTGTISCLAGTYRIEGCDAAMQEFMFCTACIAPPTGDACDTCMAQNCCVELKSLYSEANFMPFLNCRLACIGTSNQYACWTECDAKYPNMVPKMDAYNFCMGGPCYTECGP